MRKVFAMTVVIGLLALPLCTLLNAGGGITKGNYDFSTFDIPGTPSGAGVLAIEQINDEGFIVGYRRIPPLDDVGFLRSPWGTSPTRRTGR
jgi:hypothetical protein